MRISTKKAATALAGAAAFCSLHHSPCLGHTSFVRPLHPRHCSAIKRALPYPRSNRNHVLKLAAGGPPRPVGESTPLSRARDVLFEPAFRSLLPPMAAAGALLGPNLDNYHSAFGVLTYKHPIELTVAGHLIVTTDWW